jgi:hypothetical protein
MHTMCLGWLECKILNQLLWSMAVLEKSTPKQISLSQYLSFIIALSIVSHLEWPIMHHVCIYTVEN